jgi:hypothetical protein
VLEFKSVEEEEINDVSTTILKVLRTLIIVTSDEVRVETTSCVLVIGKRLFEDIGRDEVVCTMLSDVIEVIEMKEEPNEVVLCGGGEGMIASEVVESDSGAGD